MFLFKNNYHKTGLSRYWKIRGLKTPITYVLEYIGAEYKEELYELKKKDDGSLVYSKHKNDTNKTT